MLDFAKAQRMSLTQQVENNIKNALIIGALKPGARLVTREIAENQGISITPVREALLRLVSLGALQLAGNKPDTTKSRRNGGRSGLREYDHTKNAGTPSFVGVTA